MGWAGLGTPPEKSKGSEFEVRVVAVSGLSWELSEVLSGEEWLPLGLGRSPVVER